MTDACYAGGYTLLRYMTKQAATSFKGMDEDDSFWTHNDLITIVSGLDNGTIESEGDKNSLTSASQNSLILYGGGSGE